MRDGRPHLIVLDGLERVQEDAGSGRVRGELSDHSLKLLLRAMAAGLGRARALVTSRYPLVDLEPWTNRGYRDTSLDDLSPDAAVAVLRGWGVGGDDEALRAAAAQVGNHALSVAVLGSYLRSFAGGRIEAVKEFDLDAVTGDDPRAAKLARVLAYYAQRLPEEERELLDPALRVSPRGDARSARRAGRCRRRRGGTASEREAASRRVSGSLRARGLVFQYRSDETVTWTAHPFLRERFRELLGCPPERVFDVVAQALGAGLEKRPDTKPRDLTTLDRYERLIEATRLAGREQEAFDLYWDGLGGYKHLGWVLGEYERCYRILAAFSATGQPQDLGVTMALVWRPQLANSLALFAKQLGRLAEARAIRRLGEGWIKSQAEPRETSGTLRNSIWLSFAMGSLAEARELANEAINEAETAKAETTKKNFLAHRATAAHALGDIAAARADFAAATELEHEPLYSLRGSQHARHYLDLGDLVAAHTLADHGLKTARSKAGRQLPAIRRIASSSHSPRPRSHAPPRRDPRLDLTDWRHGVHHRGAPPRGATPARPRRHSGRPRRGGTGLLHAVTCGYGLLRIELLIALARIRLAWPDPPKAIQAAREALDLAAHPDCGYAWGEAVAAQVWGEAYFANGELALATRVHARPRSAHTDRASRSAETERWLPLG